MAQYELMMKLIASEVCGARLDGFDMPELSVSEFKGLYKLSCSHDLSHIVASALSKRGALKGDSEVLRLFEKQMMTSFYRYEQIDFAYNELCETLERHGIDFIPLKGAIIRKYYPEGWMRTSCDIDVLVHKEELDKVCDMLESELSYTNRQLTSHDVSLYTAGGVHIELHYDLLEDDRANSCREILAQVWSFAYKKQGCSHWHELSDDMFFFYHIAHMAKHLEAGGCGVRPFLDLWILTHNFERDTKARCLLLEKGRLLAFSDIAQKLSEVWFGSREHSDLTLQLEEFILGGGVYGTRQNKVAVMQNKRGGKIKYALSRIFLKYDVIKYQYPVLFKHKWLLPVANVRRWFRLIFCGGAKRSIKEFKMNGEISKDDAQKTSELFRQIGL